MTDRKGPTRTPFRLTLLTARMAALLPAITMAIALVFVAASVQPASAQTFLAGFEDVPLMDGLTADEDAGLVFDSPAGRIVEAYAVGEVAWPDVITFYTATLQSLGWRTLGQGRFAREGEELHIDRFGRDGDLTVRFTLAPN
ncbi:hypothetical protein EOI86_12620 [Hwanghaeella grinnelliae]|uniref:Uncharacterized protein n=1 Tax=Hwanghaeella grinnelliae TaxID=2500179 RepID=A0A437QNN4_9PROT|nr:hypothetical protein [Hwanghaeella grinnelliae]RVU36070.1 hypothetical protein EOI86_12620 [Hwanghaeella grinnelliae]